MPMYVGDLVAQEFIIDLGCLKGRRERMCNLADFFDECAARVWR